MEAFKEADRSQHVQLIQRARKLQREFQAHGVGMRMVFIVLPVELQQELVTSRLVDLQQ